MAARKKGKKQLSKRGKVALVLVGLLLVAALGYFVLVRPKQNEAKELDAKIAQLETQYIAETSKVSVVAPKIEAPELFRLAKAMPDRADMAGVILELNEVASATGIEFMSISPGTSEPRESFQALPVDLVFEGDFYSLSDFLFRLRNLVRMHDGKLDARGRLFAVESISFAESAERFPKIQAALRVHAFVYGTGVPASTAPPPAETGTTGTTTAPSTTTPDPSQPPAPPESPTAAPGGGTS
jgi:Tfp pilus assembly protein PilO